MKTIAINKPSEVKSERVRSMRTIKLIKNNYKLVLIAGLVYWSVIIVLIN